MREWGWEGKGEGRERDGRGGEGRGELPQLGSLHPPVEREGGGREEGKGKGGERREGKEDMGGKGEESGDYHPHWWYDNLAALVVILSAHLTEGNRSEPETG